jgi:hypothetical protein
MSFCDLSLARRLEAADAEGFRAYVAALPPGRGAAVDLGGGVIAFAGAASPLSKAVGLGMERPLAEGELALLERFYDERGVAPAVDLCPLADHSLAALLYRRGFAVGYFKNIWSLPLPSVSLKAPPEVSVTEAGPGDLDLWIGTAARGFSGGEKIAPEDLEIATPTAYSARCFIARLEGEAVGAGAMRLSGGVAHLFSTSVRAAFRRRGVHAALLRARLTAAAGAEIAMVHASPGGASDRNIERAGFPLAYTKPCVRRAL